jgi:hypothetical protein
VAGPALIVTTGSGVLVSEDGALSFTSGTGLPEGTPHGLAVSSFFAKDPVLFTAVGCAGVFRSADGGRTWNPAGLDGQSVRDIVWLGPILYAASRRGPLPQRRRRPEVGAGRGLAARPAIQILFPLAPTAASRPSSPPKTGSSTPRTAARTGRRSGAPEDRVLRLATFPPPTAEDAQVTSEDGVGSMK